VEQQRPVDNSQQRPSSGLGAVNPAGSPELSRWILDPSEIISNMEIWLKGARVVRDEKGRPQIVDGPEELQMLNEQGRQFVLSFLYSALQRNVVLSNLDERNIGDITYDMHLHLVSEFAKNWENYGVKHAYQIPIIIDQISMNIYASLSRAKKGEAWIGLRQISVVTENISKTSPTEQRGNIFTNPVSMR
jgi:hypothetical protein